MHSRRRFTQIAFTSLALPLARLRAQTPASEAATVRGVKLGAITGVYGPFSPAAGQDVVDVVIARPLEAGIGHVELVNTLFEPRVTGGAVGGRAPATFSPEYLQTRTTSRIRRSRRCSNRCKGSRSSGSARTRRASAWARAWSPMPRSTRSARRFTRTAW